LVAKATLGCFSYQSLSARSFNNRSFCVFVTKHRKQRQRKEQKQKFGQNLLPLPFGCFASQKVRKTLIINFFALCFLCFAKAK
jgi:hypothetical protein